MTELATDGRLVIELAATPTETQRSNRCRRCRRVLRDPASIERGMGPVCATRWLQEIESANRLRQELTAAGLVFVEPQEGST